MGEQPRGAQGWVGVLLAPLWWPYQRWIGRHRRRPRTWQDLVEARSRWVVAVTAIESAALASAGGWCVYRRDWPAVALIVTGLVAGAVAATIRERQADDYLAVRLRAEDQAPRREGRPDA